MKTKIIIKIIILVFLLLVAAYLIIIASGFKFNWSEKKFVHTGTIYLRSNIQDVKIYLNGKLRSSKSPHKIKYLLPGEYDIKIEKEGYKTWEKRIKVEAQFVNDEREIILFYNDAKVRDIVKVEGMRGAIVSASKDEVIYYSESSLYYQKIDDSESQVIKNFTNQKIAGVKASDDFDRILIETENISTKIKNYLICQDKNCTVSFDVNKRIGIDFSRIELEGKSRKDFIAFEGKNLNYIDPYSGTRNFIDRQTRDAAIFDGKLYYLKTNTKYSSLVRANLNGLGKKEIFIGTSNVDLREASIFADYKRGDLYLALANGSLYMLREDNNGLEIGLVRASDINFENRNLILFEGNGELWIEGRFKPDEEKETVHLVARYASLIEEINWIKETNHVLFLADGSLRTVEKTGSNETELYKFSSEELKQFFPTKANEILVLDGDSLKVIEVTKASSLLDFF